MQPFDQFGGGEIILILALLIILFGAKKLPEIAKGLGKGIFEIRKALDDVAIEAGRSLGGIYGKPAGEALTPDNQVAELYEPAVLENDSEPRKRPNRFTKMFINIIQRIRSLLLNRHA
jgi:sec-independent protein translocase protein TatA